MSDPQSSPSAPPPPNNPQYEAAAAELLKRYWRANLTIMAVLLSIWAIAGLGCGILFADVLNQYKLGGYPLGFWFAQQGSIITFVLIILTYCILLNRLDSKHHEQLAELKTQHGVKSPTATATEGEAR